nr:13216_t:CDS:2 [Entrophospora candida]
MIDSKIKKEQTNYLERMQNYLDNKDVFSIKKEFIELKNKNIAPTLEIYHVLLKSCIITEDLFNAIEIIRQMHNDFEVHKSPALPIKETFKYLLEVAQLSTDHFLVMDVVKFIFINEPIPSKSQRKIVKYNQESINLKNDLELWQMAFSVLTRPDLIYTTNSLRFFKDINKIISELNYLPNPEPLYAIVLRYSEDGYFLKCEYLVNNINSNDGNEFSNSLFYQSWKKLTSKIQQLSYNYSNFHRDHYDLTIRFNALANQIDSMQFPLDKTLEMIDVMRGEGFEPSYETYLILLKCHSQNPDFLFDPEKINLHVNKMLKILDMMELSGYNIDNLQIFEMLFEACLPQNEQRNFNFLSVNLNCGLWHQEILKMIRKIEDLMINKFHLNHNQTTISTIFRQLGSLKLFNEFWTRWNNIPTAGYRRSEGLYYVVLDMASKNSNESDYAINVVRHQMKRESPPVMPDLKIYLALIKCCIKCKDSKSMETIINEMKNSLDNNINEMKDNLDNQVLEKIINLISDNKNF